VGKVTEKLVEPAQVFPLQTHNTTEIVYFPVGFQNFNAQRTMQKLNLSVDASLTEDQKIEAYYDTVNHRLVVAVVVSPKFFEAIQKQASELIKYSPDDALIADNTPKLTIDGVQLFIKNMRDDFKLINSEEEFNLIVKGER
jgi:hypothetical protein